MLLDLQVRVGGRGTVAHDDHAALGIQEDQASRRSRTADGRLEQADGLDVDGVRRGRFGDGLPRGAGGTRTDGRLGGRRAGREVEAGIVARTGQPSDCVVRGIAVDLDAGSWSCWARVLVTSKPIRFPRTTFPDVPDPVISMP